MSQHIDAWRIIGDMRTIRIHFPPSARCSSKPDSVLPGHHLSAFPRHIPAFVGILSCLSSLSHSYSPPPSSSSSRAVDIREYYEDKNGEMKPGKK